MAKTAWVTEAELTTELTGYGITAPDGLTLQDVIDEVTSDVETLTGYQPFIQGASGDHYYDPPALTPGLGFSLFFRGGFTAVSALAVGVTTDFAGTTLTENVEYWLKPYGAPTRKRPFRYIEFLRCPTGSLRSIKVTGTPGFSDNIPLDLWMAHKREAARRVMDLPNVHPASATEIKEGQVTLKFSKSVSEQIRAEFMSAINKYKADLF